MSILKGKARFKPFGHNYSSRSLKNYQPTFQSLQATNPEEIFEDYLLDNRPGDNYIRFKINLKKQKIKIEKLLIELRASQKKSDYEIKKYNPKLKIKNKNFFNSKY